MLGFFTTFVVPARDFGRHVILDSRLYSTFYENMIKYATYQFWSIVLLFLFWNEILPLLFSSKTSFLKLPLTCVTKK